MMNEKPFSYGSETYTQKNYVSATEMEVDRTIQASLSMVGILQNQKSSFVQHLPNQSAVYLHYF